MPDEAPPSIPACPIDCPNRSKSATQQVRFGCYFAALLASGFLAFQCVSYDKRNQETPVQVWFPCISLTFLALGINLDAGWLGTFLSSRK